MRRQPLSHSEHDERCYRDSSENATYRVITFSGPVPEFEREKDRAWNLKNERESLRESSPHEISSSLASPLGPATLGNELGPAMRDL
ncbi:hypothetical protein Taro_011468, partial [Colocasia esculenta]|nr:hypothetical protein [Colocasia esculenta]